MRYYFLGIGGVSMSALAILLKSQGNAVCGYDERESKGTEILQQNKIEVDFEIDSSRLQWPDVIVYSSAIKKDNPIYVQAEKTKKKMICRGELLGQIASGFEKVIAVAGAHGKTTTTSMIYEVLKCAGKNPTLHLGGYRAENGKNCCIAGKEFFVTEACEYCDNFLYLAPYLSVVTNIEKEHMDYFKTFENEKASFDKFKSQSKVVVDDISEFSIKNIRHRASGGLCFSLYQYDQKLMRLNLNICEEINATNCIFAYKACKLLGIEDCIIKQGLENFRGVELRFQKFKSSYFDNVICDYAHHPTEISKAIMSAKKIYKNKQIVTIFQPHTFSRTKTLLKEFLEVFKYCEVPLLFKTYSAREKMEDGVSAKDFCELLKKYNKNAKYFENFYNLKAFLQTFNKKETVLLFVGAGDLPEILHKNLFIS